jgi:hypothetical protein
MFEVEFTSPNTGVKARYWEVATVAFDFKQGVCQANLEGRLYKNKEVAVTQSVTIPAKDNLLLQTSLPELNLKISQELKRLMGGSNEQSNKVVPMGERKRPAKSQKKARVARRVSRKKK